MIIARILGQILQNGKNDAYDDMTDENKTEHLCLLVTLEEDTLRYKTFSQQRFLLTRAKYR